MSGNFVNVIATKSGPGIEKVMADIKALQASEVYVGVPQQSSSRPGEAVNNAELMYIHTYGSPVNNIPPRPVIEPAITAADNSAKLSAQFVKVAQSIFAGQLGLARQQLRGAGMMGANMARAWFVDSRNNWAPNAPLTVALKGSDRPLIDTAVLRRSITFVVRGDDR